MKCKCKLRMYFCILCAIFVCLRIFHNVSFVDSFFSFRSSFIYTSRHAKTHCGPSGTHTHTHHHTIYMCLCVCVYTHVPACLHTCVYVYYIVFRQALLSSSILHTSSNLLYSLLIRLFVGCSLDCNVYFVVKKNKKNSTMWR